MAKGDKPGVGREADAPERLFTCCEDFAVVGVGGRGTNEPAISQGFGFGFIDKVGTYFFGKLFVRFFDEVSLDPGDVLVIEGVLWAFVCGDGFSDEGEVAVFDSFGEDFLFEDFSVCLDEFALVRRELLQGIVEVINFDDAAKGNQRAIGRDGGPVRGGFFGGDLGQRAGIAIDDKQGTVFTVDAFGAVFGPLEGILWEAAGNKGGENVRGGER